MAYEDNRPQLDRLKRKLATFDLTTFDNDVLADQLQQAIASVEDVASTRFNAAVIEELYDGNGTNQLTLRKRPMTRVDLVSVQTPILGYTRTYTPQEIQLYVKQGILKVFTFKLAVEQALLNTLDYQAWGTIFPPLPRNVHVVGSYGYPQFDPEANVTTRDGGLTSEPGDTRDLELNNWLENLKEAAICDAAAGFLAHTAALRAGIVQSVSFDGYSRSFNPAGFQPQVQSLTQRRDELLGRRRRRFGLATIG